MQLATCFRSLHAASTEKHLGAAIPQIRSLSQASFRMPACANLCMLDSHKHCACSHQDVSTSALLFWLRLLLILCSLLVRTPKRSLLQHRIQLPLRPQWQLRSLHGHQVHPGPHTPSGLCRCIFGKLNSTSCSLPPSVIGKDPCHVAVAACGVLWSLREMASYGTARWMPKQQAVRNSRGAR